MREILWKIFLSHALDSCYRWKGFRLRDLEFGKDSRAMVNAVIPGDAYNLVYTLFFFLPVYGISKRVLWPSLRAWWWPSKGVVP